METTEVEIEIFNDGQPEQLETFQLQIMSGESAVCTTAIWIQDASEFSI